jgi:hypothetical protein
VFFARVAICLSPTVIVYVRAWNAATDMNHASTRDTEQAVPAVFAMVIVVALLNNFAS